MPPASAILSPLASPFYPSTLKSDGSFSVVYNDGNPGFTMNEHEVIANIPDNTIDEVFPPSAVDAAEMDAVDDFLNVMVDLSFIEDREERGRADLGFVTPKRWEAKRKDGLKGRPHLSCGRIERINHELYQINLNEKRLVPHARHSRSIENKHNAKYMSRLTNDHSQKRNALTHRYTKTIQQPRKQN